MPNDKGYIDKVNLKSADGTIVFKLRNYRTEAGVTYKSAPATVTVKLNQGE